MDLGIIGLARSGKTSLFNAVTRGQAQVGAYSSQSEPNVGVARVPDARVDALAAVFKPKKTTYAEIRWVDYPVAGFGAEGPGSRFLADPAPRTSGWTPTSPKMADSSTRSTCCGRPGRGTRTSTCDYLSIHTSL